MLPDVVQNFSEWRKISGLIGAHPTCTGLIRLQKMSDLAINLPNQAGKIQPRPEQVLTGIEESGRHMERISNGRKENQLVKRGQSRVR
jgi:hypothetical protein